MMICMTDGYWDAECDACGRQENVHVDLDAKNAFGFVRSAHATPNTDISYEKQLLHYLMERKGWVRMAWRHCLDAPTSNSMEYNEEGFFGEPVETDLLLCRDCANKIASLVISLGAKPYLGAKP